MPYLLDSPSAIVCQFLINEGLFQVPNTSSTTWPIYDSYLPDIEELPQSPDFLDNAAAVFDSEGLKDGRFMVTGETFFHYGFQLMVRSSSKPGAWSQVQSSIQFFDSVNRTTVVVGSNSYLLYAVTTVNEPIYLGIDPGTKRRRVYTVNCRATVGPS